MMRRQSTPESLGEFEQAVLLALVRLGPVSYGAAVHEELESCLERTVSFSAVYATLDRLEKKGLVRSRVGEPTPQRGGRRKKFFQLSPAGARSLRHSYRALMKMIRGVERQLEAL